MKKYSFSILFLLLINFGFAQNISIDNVISIRTKTIAGIEEFLTGKNWEMLSAVEPDEETMGKIDFAYKKNNYDDKAESFIKFMYHSYDPKYNRILFQVNKIEAYKQCISRLKVLGYKLENSYVEEGSIVKEYEGRSIKILVKTITQKELSSIKTSYSFVIYNIKDYENLFQTEEESEDLMAVIDSAAAVIDSASVVYSSKSDYNKNIDEVEFQSRSFIEYLGKGNCETAFNFTKVPQWEEKGKDWFCSSNTIVKIREIKELQVGMISIDDNQAKARVSYFANQIQVGVKKFSKLFTLTKFSGEVWLITKIEDE